MTPEAFRFQPAASPDPNLQQRRASAPEDNVWVGASAGSGKTSVLTARVLRLLLPDPAGRWPGTQPHRILCITFTKAGASEMTLRIQKALSDWAVMPEPELAAALAVLTGQVADAALIAAARRLFAAVLECPGGLKIMTIHSFCQSVLGRFPVEAGVIPNFTVLDEPMAQQLFTQGLEEILRRAQTSQDGELGQAFYNLAPLLSLSDLRINIREVLRHPDRLAARFTGRPDLADLKGQLREALGVVRGLEAGVLLQDFIAATPVARLRQAVAAMAGSRLQKAQKAGLRIQTWLEYSDAGKADGLEFYRAALLTKDNTALKHGSFAKDEPELAALLEAEAERYLAYLEQTIVLQQTEATAALMLLAEAVASAYDSRKRQLGGLDYDDLIRKTDRLLAATSSQWVHFKLDGGIDHFLMDEAQDTNPEQWNILKNLSADMFSGQGRDAGQPRTLFVVGDEKQSIFSFQGADPVAFDRMRKYFTQRAQDIERDLVPVPLEISFRSAGPILEVVDAAFDSPPLLDSLGAALGKLRHFSHRGQDAGLVELWPLQKRAERKKADEWVLPFEAGVSQPAGGSLAEQMAAEISFWVQRGEQLESKGRAIVPGDILILVRTRTPFVVDLIRQLKRRGLAVAGIDRLLLADQIGVQDLLVLGQFARLPADEFSLATVLRSPLIDLPEAQLMQLSLRRLETGQSLWTIVQALAAPAISAWLQRLVTKAAVAAPFEFFEYALTHGCPADPAGSGWRAMTGRLGHDVIDPLEELLSLSLRLEAQGVRTLESLILWQQKTPVEIKREMEEAGNQIRIMTVHGAKGLEAPVVILPDTTSVPARARTPRFLWPETTTLPVPLWSPAAALECEVFRDARQGVLEEHFEEYARLLYVALTRARDRLYIMGTAAKGSQDRSWYATLEAAFGRLNEVEILDNGRRRLSSRQLREPASKPVAPAAVATRALPAWLGVLPRAERTRQDAFQPSQLLHPAPVLSPATAGQPDRFRRGQITHRLLELLPGLHGDLQEQAARDYVAKAAHALSANLRESIVAETLAVLRHEEFGAVFGPGSLAEVPVTGTLTDGRLISGQLDRLIVQENRILIVDYKTNRPSPDDPRDIPSAYIEQVRSYRDALALIYPNHMISCALLWTDRPLLMRVEL